LDFRRLKIVLYALVSATPRAYVRPLSVPRIESPLTHNFLMIGILADKEGFSMKNLKHLPSVLSIAFVLACFNVVVLAQSGDDKLAGVTNLGSSLRFDISATYESGTLAVTGPDGYAKTKGFKAGTSPEIRLSDSRGDKLPDGQYTYELRLTST